MAVFKLSNEIWWGDMNSPVEQAGNYRSLIDLASNYTADDKHYRLSQVPNNIPILRFPTNEDQPLNGSEILFLERIYDVIHAGNFYPLLIHCMAGQCRSPMVAVHAEFMNQVIKGNGYKTDSFIAIYSKMRVLRFDIDDKRAFHADLKAHLRYRCEH